MPDEEAARRARSAAKPPPATWSVGPTLHSSEQAAKRDSRWPNAASHSGVHTNACDNLQCTYHHHRSCHRRRWRSSSSTHLPRHNSTCATHPAGCTLLPATTCSARAIITAAAAAAAGAAAAAPTCRVTTRLVPLTPLPACSLVPLPRRYKFGVEMEVCIKYFPLKFIDRIEEDKFTPDDLEECLSLPSPSWT